MQPGYHRSIWITGLSASTTYYIGLKALDEVSNASELATVSTATPAASLLMRPLLQPDDFEYLGAFKLPQLACGMTTGYAASCMALRRVNGDLQILTCTHVYADGIYECNFPGWGADQSTWPQATLVREWGMAVYGNPSVKTGPANWTCGLSYDPATGRLYYSYASGYYVAQTNIPSLGCAVLEKAGPVVSGPWMSQDVTTQVMRGGSLMIRDWFADTYLDGRKLGVGFGGGWSGWASCSPGPTLAAHHPDGSTTQLDTIRLLQYDQTDLSHWATRETDYWSDGVYNLRNPVGDVGYWTSKDSIQGASVWIDLPDKQGLLYLTAMAHGRIWYEGGIEDAERREAWWRVYDPADLAEVTQGNTETWEPQHDFWPMPYQSPGCAFDAQTRTVFVIVPGSYSMGGQERFPLVHGYRIKESFNICAINKDGSVDVVDLLYFVDSFGLLLGDPGYDPRCDFNGDGCVDVIDLLMFVESFGTL